MIEASGTFLAFLSDEEVSDVARSFMSLVLEGAPFIVLGTIISGFIHAYLPSSAMDRILPKKDTLAVFAAGTFGLFFPVCECAIVPVIRRLVIKGLPLSCAVTYMLSAPAINVISIASTATAFTGDGAAYMSISRVLMTYIVTVTVGLIFLRFKPEQILKERMMTAVGSGGGDHDHSNLPGDQKLTLAMRTALRDFLDTCMYFSIGALITSVFNEQMERETIERIGQNDFQAVPAAMGMGFLLSLCSTSDAFIAATNRAISSTAKLAFLVYGPMMDLKLVFMYATIFKKKVVFWLVIGLFVLVGLVCVPWAMVHRG